MIVIDNFIQDESLLKAIDNDKTFLALTVITLGGMVGGTHQLIQLKNN